MTLPSGKKEVLEVPESLDRGGIWEKIAWEVFYGRIPQWTQACHCTRTHPAKIHKSLCKVWGLETVMTSVQSFAQSSLRCTELLHCGAMEATGSSHDMGLWTLWRWHSSPRLWRHRVRPSHGFCICCSPRRWICGHVGQSTIRWREHISARFLENVKKGPFNRRCLCHHPGKQIRRDMGLSRSWWWQLCRQRWNSGMWNRSTRQKEGRFAAILADRSVVTWGHPSAGGDSFWDPRISCRFCRCRPDSRFSGYMVHSQLSWKTKSVCVMGQSRLWWRKALQWKRELVDVRVVEATSERMDLWLAGATQTWVVTARLFSIDWGTWSRSRA